MEIKNISIINLSGKIKEKDLIQIEHDISFIKNKFPYIKFSLIKETFSNPDPKFLAKSLIKAILDNKTDLIIIAKGGVRSIELIDHININIKLNNKKIILGSSDFCHLAPFLNNIKGLDVFIGLNLKSFSKLNKESIEKFEDTILKGKPLDINREEIEIYKKGVFSGKIIPGNDVVLLNILAIKPKLINFENKILALENHTEKDPRMIKYWLCQYKFRGILKKIKGLILGDFPLIKEGFLKNEILDICSEYNFPILKIKSFGEGNKKSPFKFEGFSEYKGKDLIIS
ncbi:LD-carboxypeptidase [Candidatus Pacearchaeota archaeon]|nr:LD-carboxypeptidase [Candidatus Pacearchaeota archaeon]